MPSYASDQSISPQRELMQGRMSARAAITAHALTVLGHRIVKTTVADGLTPMPDGVYSIADSNLFIHPNGQVRPYYSPAQHD